MNFTQTDRPQVVVNSNIDVIAADQHLPCRRNALH